MGQYQVAATIASGASTSGGADLGMHFNKVYVYVGSMSTQAAIAVQDSPDGGTTYFNKFEFVASSTTQAAPVVIGSAVGTNGGMIELNGGRYLRFIASAVVSGGVAFKVVGVN